MKTNESKKTCPPLNSRIFSEDLFVKGMALILFIAVLGLLDSLISLSSEIIRYLPMEILTKLSDLQKVGLSIIIISVLSYYVYKIIKKKGLVKISGENNKF